MFSALLGFSVLAFCLVAPGVIVWAAGKTMGDWSDRIKSNKAEGKSIPWWKA